MELWGCREFQENEQQKRSRSERKVNVKNGKSLSSYETSYMREAGHGYFL